MSDLEFWKDLGNIFDAVLNYQKKNVEFNNRFINPWIRLGNIFERDDKNQEAVKAYKHAAEIDPDNAQNWASLGDAHFKAGSYDEAIASYQRSAALDSEAGWPLGNLALTLVAQGKVEEAIPLYLKSINLLTDPEDKAICWNRLGNAYRKVNDYENAFDAFRQADQLDSGNTGFEDRMDETPEISSSAPAEILEQVMVEPFVEESAQPELEDETVQSEQMETESDVIALAPNMEINEEAFVDTAAETAASLESALPAVEILAKEEIPPQMDENFDVVKVIEEVIAKVESESAQEVEIPSETESAMETESESELNAVAKNEPMLEAEPIIETESMLEVESAPEVEIIDKIEPALETESVIETELMLEVDFAPGDVAEAKFATEAEAVNETEATMEAHSTPEAEPKSIMEAESALEVETVAEPEPIMEAESALEVETVAEPEPIMEAESALEVETVIEPEPIMESESALEVETVAEPALVTEGESTPRRVPAWLTIKNKIFGNDKTSETEAQQETEQTESVTTLSDIPQNIAVNESSLNMDVVETYADPITVQLVNEQPNLSSEAPVIEQTGNAASSTTTDPADESNTTAEEPSQNEPAYQEYLTVAEEVLTDHVDEIQTEAPVAHVSKNGEVRIAMDTNNAHVWNELGNVYMNAGSYEEAIASYRKAIDLDRHFAWPYSNLALAYVHKGSFAEAILLYQRGIELFTADKDKAITWNRLGSVYRRINDYDNAIEAYKIADELDPENATLSLRASFGLLGNMYSEQKPAYVI